jgi:hypothetical protein
MPSNADNVILTFPPRPISQWERTLVAEWYAAAQHEGFDIARAFVSGRRGDDPQIAGRIVVVVRPNRDPTHLVYSPQQSAFWVVASGPDWHQLKRFRTLRAALNSIRPVLEMPDPAHGAEVSGTLVW